MNHVTCFCEKSKPFSLPSLVSLEGVFEFAWLFLAESHLMGTQTNLWISSSPPPPLLVRLMAVGGGGERSCPHLVYVSCLGIPRVVATLRDVANGVLGAKEVIRT